MKNVKISEIRTEHLPNINLVRYRYTDLKSMPILDERNLL
jgi:hypothetical protein